MIYFYIFLLGAIITNIIVFLFQIFIEHKKVKEVIRDSIFPKTIIIISIFWIGILPFIILISLYELIVDD